MSHLPPSPDDGAPADPDRTHTGPGDDVSSEVTPTAADGAGADLESVSAALDGEATEAEVARIESDPELRARRDELAAVRDAVAAPVPALDELTARRLRERAMAARSEPADSVSAVASRRPERRPAALIGIGAAAVVLLVALIALPGLIGGGDEPTSDLATGSAEQLAEEAAELFSSESADDSERLDDTDSFADAGDDGAAPGDAPPDGDGDAPAAPADELPWLGTYGSVDEIGPALSDRPSTAGDAASARSTERAGCGTGDPPWADYDQLELWEAVVEDELVLVVVGTEPAPTTPEWWVVTVSDCTVLGTDAD